MPADEPTSDDVGPGTVRRLGGWAAGRTPAGEAFAVPRRCRRQLADLSRGTVDADGCLVCPWHQSRFDVGSGRTVAGPRGFFGYHGPSPGYTALVLAYARRLRLAVGRVAHEAGRLVVRRCALDATAHGSEPHRAAPGSRVPGAARDRRYG